MTALLHVVSECCYAMPCQYQVLVRMKVSVHQVYESFPHLHDMVFFLTFVIGNLHAPCTLACFVCCMLQVGACTLELLQRFCTQSVTSPTRVLSKPVTRLTAWLVAPTS